MTDNSKLYCWLVVSVTVNSNLSSLSPPAQGCVRAVKPSPLSTARSLSWERGTRPLTVPPLPCAAGHAASLSSSGRASQTSAQCRRRWAPRDDVIAR